MKAIFIPCIRRQSWVEKYFYGQSLCSLPLTGKPIAEYFLDLCQELHIGKARILDAVYQRSFAHYLVLRKNNYVPFSYHGEQIPRNFAALLKHHSIFCRSDVCLIFYGTVLPVLEKAEDFQCGFSPADKVEESGIYRISGTRIEKYTGPVYRIDSMQEYFQLNFTFLNEEFYNIPGYREQGQTILGINTLTEESCSLQDKILIGDRSKINGHCTLRNKVIIGDETLIMEGATLDHSLIFGHTYVPRNLTLVNKIVTPDRIIDPYTGGQLKRRKMSGFCWNFDTLHRLSIKFMKKSLAGVLILLTLPLVLLLKAIPFPPQKNYHCFRTRFLARHAGFWQVLKGRRQLIHSYSKHFPPKAVFSLAGCYSRSYTLYQRRHYGWYFTRHSSCRLILLIIWKNLFN